MKRFVIGVTLLLACLTIDSVAQEPPLDTLTLRQGDVRILKVGDGTKASGVQGALETDGVASAVPGLLFTIIRHEPKKLTTPD